MTADEDRNEALRFQENLVQLITENATTAIFMMDDKSRCTFMNPAAERMTGFAFEEIRGGILHDFIHHHHPDGRPYPMPECPIDRALPEEFDVVGHEDIFIRKNGEFFPVQVNAKAIRKDGKAIGTVIEVRDVTVEREALKALADADRQKDEFIATLAHELRNPLAPITVAASILTSAKATPDKLEYASGVIQRQVSHMAALLDDLLDVARITRGKLRIARNAVSLGGVMDTAVEIALPTIQRKQHRFERRVQAGLQVDVDPLRVSQAVGNLLTNAAKYTDPGGLITLVAEADGDALRIRVTDNGIGLSQEALSKLFRMFGQADGDGPRSEGGLGIGLALAKGLIELHHGSLTASSHGKGHGSEFCIRIPNAILRVADAAVADDPAPIAGNAYKIVVADDNRDAAGSLAVLLELAGHSVRVAYGGAEAIRTIEQFRPHAALVDIGMPDLDGYEVARSLRGSPAGRDLVLFALTGWGQQSDRERAIEAGFDRHMTKPVDPRHLQEALASMLRGRPSARS